MSPVPRSGALTETPLPRLLIELYHEQFSGRVQIRKDRVEKSFLFDRGIPMFAESNLASESLGVRLMDAGKITRHDYTRLVSQVESRGCKEGAALLELGLIEPRELFLSLKEQVRSRLVECFGWASGEFDVDASVKPPEDAHSFRADVYAILQEGIETHWGIDRVLADLEPNMSRIVVHNDRLAQIQDRLLTDDATLAMMGAMDGAQTLWQALQLATTPRAMAAAWVLEAGRAIEFRDTAAKEEDSSTEIEVVFDTATDVSTSARGSASAESVRDREQDAQRAAALEQEIAERFSGLDELDHYELLGLEPTAQTAEIKAAYLRAAKGFHPDALARAGLDPDTIQQANKVFAQIAKAYSVLSNPQRRDDYDGMRNSDWSANDAERLANAESLFRKGDILLRQGNFKGAIEFLLPAVEMWPEEADYRSAVGWALYKKMPSEPESAKEHLEHALKRAPNDGVVLFRLSIVLRALGDAVAASTLMEKARKLDPKLT